MTACASCGMNGAVLVVLSHQRKGEAQPVEWSINACCWSQKTLALDAVKATGKVAK